MAESRARNMPDTVTSAIEARGSGASRNARNCAGDTSGVYFNRLRAWSRVEPVPDATRAAMDHPSFCLGNGAERLQQAQW